MWCDGMSIHAMSMISHEIGWWDISVVQVSMLCQWYLTELVGEIYLWYNYSCYVHDISRNYLVRYLCGTSDTSDSSDTSNTKKAVNSSNANETSASVSQHSSNSSLKVSFKWIPNIIFQECQFSNVCVNSVDAWSC